MQVIVITKGRGSIPLNKVWDGEFCNGAKCIDVNANCYTNFESKAKAEEYITRTLTDLDTWINVEIPRQAEKWSSDTRGEFLAESQKHYEDIKKVVSKMVVKEYTI